MKKLLSILLKLFYVAVGLTALILVSTIADSMLPSRVASRIYKGNDFGAAAICSNLLKGDLEAASGPIRFKAASRELRFAETVTWLGGKGDSPYVPIPASPLFTGLPKDIGPLRSCDTPKSFNLAGDRMSATLSLGYEKYRVTVTLRYKVGLFSGRLERIEIGVPERLTPSTPPPGEDERRVREFIGKLDGMSGGQGAEGRR
ncbi:MAG: hypothetical protein M0011_02600 [Elusimicrobia bacterium]|nr:hypothetical protein [Elusimicrobiota bacterium]